MKENSPLEVFLKVKMKKQNNKLYYLKELLKLKEILKIGIQLKDSWLFIWLKLLFLILEIQKFKSILKECKGSQKMSFTMHRNTNNVGVTSMN